MAVLPAGITFPAQSTVPVSYAGGGTTFPRALSIVLNGCTAGGGGATLSCNLGTSYGNWNAGDCIRFSPQVAVNSPASLGTESGNAVPGSVHAMDRPQPSTNYTITDGTLDVHIVQSAATLMVDPLVGLDAGALVAGRGGAVVLNRRRRAGAGNEGTRQTSRKPPRKRKKVSGMPSHSGGLPLFINDSRNGESLKITEADRAG
ncbi:hypothetical protein GCM10023063_24360 [Arthrobacter methylotrophus]|uniref:hypothetical protein n=1 Tax=Arthrobacter methylotrophus TaxID=121291 RepID=UPI0031E89FC8